MPKLAFIGYLLLSTICYSQYSGNISVKGVVINKNTNNPIPFVNVINKSSKKIVSTNEEGYFIINAYPLDTLIFSAIGYSKYSLQIKDLTDIETIELTILMDTKVMELEPVDVFAYRDEKALKQAILDADVVIEKDFEIYGMPNPKTLNKDQKIGNKGWYFPYERALSLQNLGRIQVIIAKDGIISNFMNKHSKRGKEEYKYTQIVKTKMIREQKYNPKWIRQLTNLEEDEIESFIHFCKVEDEFIELSTEYELAVAVLNCLDDFKRTNK